MKLILRYNTHLATGSGSEFFRRVEPFETLYSYCKATIKQYQINEPLLTKESIESILNQTYTNWELIMCDDGSTDDTYKKAKER